MMQNPMQPMAPGGGMPPGTQAIPVPPWVHRQIDPNNPMQKLLLQRIDALRPNDIQALASIPPQAAAVLKKIFPEVGFLIDMIGGSPGRGPGYDG
jgi:hypothetical protein